MSTEGRWNVPTNWAWAEARSFAVVVGGGTPKHAKEPDNYVQNGIPWITPADLSGYTGTHIARGARDLSQKGFKACSARLMPKGTVLLSSRAPVGYCVVASNEICTNQGFKSFVLRGGGLVPEYLRYYLIGSKRYLESQASGTTFLELSGGRATQLLFPIAPSREQARIVSKIDELFSRIDEGERALARMRKLLERYRQSVLKAAVTGELTRDWREQHHRDPDHPIESGATLLERILAARRAAWEQSELAKMQAKGKPPKTDAWKQKYKPPTPPDTTNLPALPDNWVWATLDQLASAEPGAITDGPFGSKLKTAHYTSEGPRVVRLQNIKDGWFADERAHISQKHFASLQKHRVKKGDLLIAALGENPPRACVAPEWLGPAIVKADCIRIRLHDAVRAACVSAFLNSPLSRTLAKAIIHGVGRPRLNLGEIKSLTVPLCPGREQQAICDQLDLASSATEQLRKEVESAFTRSVQSKQAILGTAFSGRLVSQDPGDESASTLLERVAADRAQAVHAKPRHMRKRTERRPA